MKYLVTTLIPVLIFAGSVGTPMNVDVKTAPAGSVYICVSAASKVYHGSTSCWGLNQCKHEVRKVSQSDAVNKYGRRACRVEGCL